MQRYVAGLSDKDVDNIAAYFAVQQPKAADKVPTSTEEMAAKCNRCHDQAASPTMAAPKLKGQDKDYLVMGSQGLSLRQARKFSHARDEFPVQQRDHRQYRDLVRQPAGELRLLSPLPPAAIALPESKTARQRPGCFVCGPGWPFASLLAGRDRG